MAESTPSASGAAFDWRVLRRLLQFVRPYRGIYIFTIVLTVAAAVLAAVRPFLIQQAVDERILRGDPDGLNQMFLMLGVLLVAHALVSYLQTYFGGWLGQQVVRDI